MKTENLKSITIAILLFIIFLQFRTCENKTTTIPEVKGSLKAVKPTSNTKQLINPTTKKIDKTVAKTLKNDYSFEQSEIDTMATEIQRLKRLSDSLHFQKDLSDKQIKELVTIIQNYSKINEFKSDLSDDNILINVSGITFKNVAERVKIDYTIKERKIKTNKGLFVGGQFGSDTQLNNFTYKLDADYLYKNKIYKASFQRFGDVDFILVGGSVKLF